MVQNICFKKGHVLLRIHEITNLIENEWQKCNRVYQDAVESNYSHEQMTPLNSIISNASLIQNYLGDWRKQDLKQAIKPLISQIEQSSQIMYFHNRNQITKMQIQKGDFRSTQHVTKSPEDYIRRVIESFSFLISNRRINVHVVRKNQFDQGEILADWNNF